MFAQKNHVRNPFLEGRFGFNYQINDNHSFGGFYQNTYDYVKTRSEYDDDLLADGVAYDHLQNSSVRRDKNTPIHQANLYYTGKAPSIRLIFITQAKWGNSASTSMPTTLHADSRVVTSSRN